MKTKEIKTQGTECFKITMSAGKTNSSRQLDNLQQSVQCFFEKGL